MSNGSCLSEKRNVSSSSFPFFREYTVSKTSADREGVIGLARLLPSSFLVLCLHDEFEVLSATFEENIFIIVANIQKVQQVILH